jgi:hypothetical protein
VSIDETEHAELIAALHQTVTFGEGLLNQSERLINALVTGENARMRRAIGYMRARLARWREQMTGLWQRIAGMTMERPGRFAATPAGRGGLHTKFASRREHNSRAVPDAITWRTRDAILGPSVHVVGLGLTPREYEGHHVGTHER